jgi:hypothetical protein
MQDLAESKQLARLKCISVPSAACIWSASTQYIT